MSKTNNQYTVRLDAPITDAALRKFSLAVSDALVRLGKLSDKGSVVQGESVQGRLGSWAIALYDEITG